MAKTIEAFCVIDTRGYGHPSAIALNISQCICNYVNMLYGMQGINHEKWWAENHKKRNLRVIKVQVGTDAVIKGKRWKDTKPSRICCEIDVGGLVFTHCGQEAKHSMNGRRVCTQHKKMLESGRDLRWVPASNAQAQARPEAPKAL